MLFNNTFKNSVVLLWYKVRTSGWGMSIKAFFRRTCFDVRLYFTVTDDIYRK
ncbi:MAG: hypothetical protein WC238_00590 [Parcubacteria group bacterium]|jgi:hypothetical protein